MDARQYLGHISTVLADLRVGAWADYKQACVDAQAFLDETETPDDRSRRVAREQWPEHFEGRAAVPAVERRRGRQPS